MIIFVGDGVVVVFVIFLEVEGKDIYDFDVV